MKTVKLSTLAKNIIVIVGGNRAINTIEDILENLDFYREKSVYTTIPYHASFDAANIIDKAIEDEYQNMYDDWESNITVDVTSEDIAEIQSVFNRILAKNPEQNISYQQDKLIEFDI